MNNSPIDVPETTPYTIMPMLGGISNAMSLALMIRPMVKELGYPASRSMGRMVPPMAV